MTGDSPTPPSYREAARTWAQVAAQSFGGPAAQIAVLHRAVVEEKRWLSEAQFSHALGYCMLLPGPEAQQLATYVGWRLHGVRGGLTAGLLFILPGFIAILALSIGYATWGQVAAVTMMFAGLKPAVFAIVLEAVARLAKRALRGRLANVLAVSAFGAIFLFGVPFPVVILAAALIGAWLGGGPGTTAELASEVPLARPPIARSAATVSLWLAVWLLPVLALLTLLGTDHILSQLAVFFSKAAVVTFGGAYSVLAYVAQRAVTDFGWLSPSEMLDGLGLAETTPGPLIMVLQFVGYLAAERSMGGSPVWAGIAGSVVTTWVTFAPCFLFVFGGAPYVEWLRGRRRLAAALAGIMAAVVGVVANLAVWFALHVFFRELRAVTVGPMTLSVPTWSSVDGFAVAVGMVALVAVFRFRAGVAIVLGIGVTLGLIRWAA